MSLVNKLLNFYKKRVFVSERAQTELAWVLSQLDQTNDNLILKLLMTKTRLSIDAYEYIVSTIKKQYGENIFNDVVCL